jgi:hypothetical protein
VLQLQAVQVMFQGKAELLDRFEEMERIERLMEMQLEESMGKRLGCLFVLEMGRIAWLVVGPCPTI